MLVVLRDLLTGGVAIPTDWQPLFLLSVGILEGLVVGVVGISANDTEQYPEDSFENMQKIAREQGADLSKQMGGNSLQDFTETLQFWTRDDALNIEVIEESEEVLSFNVTRCRYAELYNSLGVGDLGTIFSCTRDFALIEGFNPDVSLTRTQTIMEGAPFCDFRYRLNN